MASNNGKGAAYELPYQRPEERTRWEQIRLTLYNPSTHEVLGRTLQSWAKISVFYLIFYSILGAFFAICMKGMLYTIDEDVPYWTKDKSLIGSSPGLGFRPISENVEAEGALIWYSANNKTNIKVWTDRIDKFLHPYANPNEVSSGVAKNQVICDFNNPAPPGKVCAPSMDGWHARCTKQFGYGYASSSPCVYIKLNKIFGWVPEYYNDSSELPDAMPQDLKSYIAAQPPHRRNVVWVSCEGENPADRENIGPIQMLPYRGIPGFYFPYLNQDGYLSPLVAVSFVRPKVNVLVNIECRAWAKNIRYRRHNIYREGSVHFELMIDT